jgi:NAD(P)-dependent dehydrogenase (short-subunit alcohol dehydrogenase family)
MDFLERVALVTGAWARLGEACARKPAVEGAAGSANREPR